MLSLRPFEQAPTRAYLVCTSPRSGSSLLCDGLESTGVAGHPKEWFGPEPLHEDRAQSSSEDAREFRALFYGITTEVQYVQRIFSLGTSRNGVFGSKLHLQQVPDAKRLLRGYLGEAHASLDRMLRTALPNLSCVWLIRRDKVAQAISWYRAQHTGSFFKADPHPHGIDRPNGPPFRADVIYRHADNFIAQDTVWAEIFRRCEIRPLTIFYEDFVTGYERSIRGILDFLGISHASVQVPPPRLQKQADEISVAWRRRFLDEHPQIQRESVAELMPWIDALLTY